MADFNKLQEATLYELKDIKRLNWVMISHKNTFMCINTDNRLSQINFVDVPKINVTSSFIYVKIKLSPHTVKQSSSIII